MLREKQHGHQIGEHAHRDDQGDEVKGAHHGLLIFSKVRTRKAVRPKKPTAKAR
jgi:hypothetical protein